MQGKMLKIITTLASILLGSPASAELEFSIVQHHLPDSFSWDPVSWPAYRDGVRMEGEISDGDAERLQDFLEENPIGIGARPTFQSIAVLDSSGGSFLEAVKIAKVVFDYNLATLVGPGDECISACAIIFMSGFALSDEDFDSSRPHRMLHVEGKVGFHAPFVDIDSIRENDALLSHTVEMSFEQLIEEHRKRTNEITKAVSELISVTPSPWPSSLLSSMMSKGPREYEFIDTVGEAVAWNIEVVGILHDNPGIKGKIYQCYNSLNPTVLDLIDGMPDVETIVDCVEIGKCTVDPDVQGDLHPFIFRVSKNTYEENWNFIEDRGEIDERREYLKIGFFNSWGNGRSCNLSSLKTCEGGESAFQKCSSDKSVYTYSPNTMLADLPVDNSYIATNSRETASQLRRYKCTGEAIRNLSILNSGQASKFAVACGPNLFKEVLHCRALDCRSLFEFLFKNGIENDYLESEAQPITFRIQEIQEGLKKLGYYQGVIDKEVGPMTMSAILKFQTDLGLPRSALPDLTTEITISRKLGDSVYQYLVESAKDAPIHIGAPVTTSEVQMVQNRISEFSPKKLKPDGIIGLRTITELLRYQYENGLEESGLPDAATLVLLGIRR